MDNKIIDNIHFKKFTNYFVFASVVISIPFFLNLNPIIVQLLSFFSILGMLFHLTKSIEIRHLSSKIYILILLLIFWNFISIMRSFEFGFRIYGRMLASPDFMLPFLFPLLSLIPIKNSTYKVINDTIILLNIIYIAGIVYFILIPTLSNISDSVNNYEFFSKRFSYANGFLLLTYCYQKKRIKLLSIVVFVISLLVSLILARRGQVLIISLFGIAAFILHLFYYNKRRILLNLIIYLTIGVIVSVSFGNRIIDSFNTNFSFFIDRIDQNTREIAEEQFYDDMNFSDYVLGRGINGKYKTSIDLDSDYEGDTRTAEEKNYRYVIETGYLNLILKEGLIGLILTMLVFFYSMYKGIFTSKNGYTKAASLLILINIVGLYPESSLSFSYRYLLIWLSIAFCLSENRVISDEVISNKIQYNLDE